jgi:hypothetical protein
MTSKLIPPIVELQKGRIRDQPSRGRGERLATFAVGRAFAMMPLQHGALEGCSYH